jgi:hypothetical protein
MRVLPLWLRGLMPGVGDIGFECGLPRRYRNFKVRSKYLMGGGLRFWFDMMKTPSSEKS